RERTEDRMAVAHARNRSGGGDAWPEGGREVDGPLERDGERGQTIACPVAHLELLAVARAAGREGGGGRDEREAEAPEPEPLVGLGGKRRRQPLPRTEHGEGERRLVPDLVAAGGGRHGPARVSELPLALVDAEPLLARPGRRRFGRGGRERRQVGRRRRRLLAHQEREHREPADEDGDGERVF